jgi:hypothetical protein
MTTTAQDVLDEIIESTEHLQDALQHQNELQRDLFNARIVLQNRKNAILTEYADPIEHPGGIKELGSNETARDAAMASLTVSETDAVKQLEFQLLQQQGNVRIAELAHDLSRYRLRVYEAEVKLDS